MIFYIEAHNDVEAQASSWPPPGYAPAGPIKIEPRVKKFCKLPSTILQQCLNDSPYSCSLRHFIRSCVITPGTLRFYYWTLRIFHAAVGMYQQATDMKLFCQLDR